LNYIHPEKFVSYDDFRRNFGDLSSQEQVERLNKVLKPYMLRRMKEDVEQSIPPLQETIIDV
jgi:chromodomain-helicase-DNA-binding protein 7